MFGSERETTTPRVAVSLHCRRCARPRPAQVMKAFFHRLHLGGSKDKDRDGNIQPPKEKEKFPPLVSWPPQTTQRPTSAVTTNSLATFKPLPEIAPAQIVSLLSSRPLQSDLEPSTEPEPTAAVSPPKVTPTTSQSDETTQAPSATSTVIEHGVRSSRKTNTSSATTGATDIQKKVAFISPPPTPLNLEQPLPSEISNLGTSPQLSGPLKTTISRFQATYGKEPRSSVSTAASSSKIDVSNVNKTTAKSTRTASPYTQKSFDGPSAQSLRSGTPYSATSNNTSGSRILAATSWSEVTEDDLVSNLGSRERTRQEVLFEIIQSEERCGKFSFLYIPSSQSFL